MLRRGGQPPPVVSSKARVEDASIKLAGTGIETGIWSSIAILTWPAVIEDGAAVPTATTVGPGSAPELPDGRTLARVGRVATVRKRAFPAAPHQESHQDG
jgi:hypothetical protein